MIQITIWRGLPIWICEAAHRRRILDLASAGIIDAKLSSEVSPLNQDVPAWCSLHRVFDRVSLCQWMIRTGMALAPDIGLLLACEVDKYIDLVASERVHELDGVLHYRNPVPMYSHQQRCRRTSSRSLALLQFAVHRPKICRLAWHYLDLGREYSYPANQPRCCAPNGKNRRCGPATECTDNFPVSAPGHAHLDVLAIRDHEVRLGAVGPQIKVPG